MTEHSYMTTYESACIELRLFGNLDSKIHVSLGQLKDINGNKLPYVFLSGVDAITKQDMFAVNAISDDSDVITKYPLY